MDWQKLAPYAVLEPLSCAVPIVAEWDSADMHFLKDPTVVVKPEQFNTEQVAKNVIALLKNEQLHKDLGERARRYILANHCRQADGEKTIKTYEKAIQEFGATQQAMKIQNLEKVLQQCSALSDRLDEWLYDFLFVRSLIFRLSHWLKELK